MSRRALAGSVLSIALLAATLPAPARAQVPAAARPWTDHALPVERRVALLLASMSRAEKLRIVSGWFGTGRPDKTYRADPLARYGSAGFVPGVPRLGIPPQWQADAGIGVATQNAAREHPVTRTSLPSGLALAASWNPVLAQAGGAMIGAEARATGYNVMLAGGVNLMRDPRNGRTFEYGGEDPLLAGTVIGAAVRGIESNHIVSTVKHYAVNDQETGRGILSSVIDHDAARMSDLLAFEIALERSDAGSIMCAYNRVNGDYSCENDWLLNRVLKGDWGWKGFVMSDWGATHSTVAAARNGLDQETGYTNAADFHFGDKLAAAIGSGEVSATRLDDMAGRVLWALFAKGVMDDPVAPGPIDLAAHAKVAQAAGTEGIVLLKNERGVLPLTASARRIAVIGGHADAGVLSGGGSAQVYPVGGNAAPGIEPTSWPGPVVYLPSSPMKAIAARAPDARVRYSDGADLAAAAALARDSDVAIVFVTQWTVESRDHSVSLPGNQDKLVEAVAAANAHTIVVMETGGPVLMPWAGRVAAAMEAWYPGTNGGEAIADVLFGRSDASGRLPVSFLASLDQLPRPTLDGEGLPPKTPFDVRYAEGAAVGYRWYDANRLAPAFPFGHGLSYTSFGYSSLSATAEGDGMAVRFTVTNTGVRAGMNVPQVYVGPPDGTRWEAPRRLGGFAKVLLEPGASTTVTVRVDPRLLASFVEGRGWTRGAGAYHVWLGASSRDLKADATANLHARILPASWHAPGAFVTGPVMGSAGLTSEPERPAG